MLTKRESDLTTWLLYILSGPGKKQAHAGAERINIKAETKEEPSAGILSRLKKALFG